MDWLPKLTADEVDELLERYDQSHPAIRRQITARFCQLSQAYLERLRRLAGAAGAALPWVEPTPGDSAEQSEAYENLAAALADAKEALQ